MGEGAAAEIDVDAVERQPLRLVDGQRPGETQRELLERAGDGLDDLLRALVVGVAARLPGDGLDLHLLAVEFDPHALLVEPGNARDRAVDPAALGIVAQQHDLGAFLQHQRLVGRLRGLRIFAGDARRIGDGRRRNRVEVGHVDAVRGGVGRRQDDVGIAFRERADRRHARIEQLEVILVDVALADAVEHVDQRLVALPEDLGEFEQVRAEPFPAARRC